MQTAPEGAARQNQTVGTQDSATPAPPFHQLVAEHERHTCWKYVIHNLGELTVVSPDGATRTEILRDLENHFPGRVVALRPGDRHAAHLDGQGGES